MIMRRMRRPPLIWFGGVGLADAILGMDGDQTVRRKIPENEKQKTEKGVSDSDGKKKPDPEPEKQ